MLRCANVPSPAGFDWKSKSANMPVPGLPAKNRLRSKSPFRRLSCSVPPTQSCPLPGGDATALRRFATPCPLASVSHVSKSGGMASTRVTASVAGSISLTWPVWFGSFVM